MPVKPQAVKYSEIALWASMLLVTVVAAIDWRTGASPFPEFLGALFMYALFCLIPYKLGQGRDWARYTLTILTVLSSAALAAGYTGEMPDLDIAVSWATLPLDLLIIYWLFKPESSAWFKQLKGAGKGA